MFLTSNILTLNLISGSLWLHRVKCDSINIPWTPKIAQWCLKVVSIHGNRASFAAALPSTAVFWCLACESFVPWTFLKSLFKWMFLGTLNFISTGGGHGGLFCYQAAPSLYFSYISNEKSSPDDIYNILYSIWSSQSQDFGLLSLQNLPCENLW